MKIMKVFYVIASIVFLTTLTGCLDSGGGGEGKSWRLKTVNEGFDEVFNWDAEGNLVSISVNGKEVSETTYKDGKLVKHAFTDVDLDYFYNDDGFLSKIIETENDGLSPRYYVEMLTYDDRGRMLVSERYSPEKIDDEPSNVVSETYIYEQGVLVRVENTATEKIVATYSYSEGKLVKLKSNDGDVTTYDYDDNGNLEALNYSTSSYSYTVNYFWERGNCSTHINNFSKADPTFLTLGLYCH